MTSTLISIKVEDEKMKSILERMDQARNEIYKCYLELGALGYAEIKKEEEH